MKSGRKYSSVGRGMVLLVLILCAAASEASANLDRYRDMIVADRDRSAAPPRKGVRVTYLGTNGYLLESQETKILIDPYFTRVNFFRAALNLRVASDRSVIERWLPSRSVAAILITHGHFDHLLDASEIAMLSGAKLIASATSTQLARSVGLPGNRCIPVKSGDVVRVGGARVKVLSARHDRIICRVPFNGPLRRIPPRSMGDWVCGEPLAFLIELGGRRIYVESGGQPDTWPEQELGRIDLAILGVALPDSRKRFPQTLKRFRPRYVLPSHQDNFFAPLSRGFIFGSMTNFPAVLRAFQQSGGESSLILLDYFQPWTLP